MLSRFHCQECVVQNACLKMELHPLLSFKYVWNVMIGHSSSGGGGQTNGNGGEAKIYM